MTEFTDGKEKHVTCVACAARHSPNCRNCLHSQLADANARIAELERALLRLAEITAGVMDCDSCMMQSVLACPADGTCHMRLVEWAIEEAKKVEDSE